MDVKERIIHNLKILQENETTTFKRKFYKQATIHLQKMPLEELFDRSDFTDIKGIGTKISEKILFVRDEQKNLEDLREKKAL